MGSPVYFPSLILNRFKSYWDYRQVFFWRESSVFRYPYLLVSYGLLGNIPDVRKELEVSPSVVLMGDSGGFQSLTLGNYFDVVDVVEWQNRNCDIAFGLDYPPYTSASRVESQEYDSRLKLSMANYKYLVENRKSSVSVYLPVHGASNVERRKWFEKVLELENFDGVAFAMPKYDPELLLSVFKLAKELNYEGNIHFLSTTSVNSVLLLSRASRFYDGVITFDSSSSEVHGSYRFLTYKGYVEMGSKETGSEENVPRVMYKKFKCFCPVCSNVPDDLPLEKYYAFVTTMHNIWMYIFMFRHIDSLSTEKHSTLSKLGFKVDDVAKIDRFFGVSEGGISAWIK
ncbi:MAG: hypothetical protein QXO47_10630 [Thermoproteota archaeon]